MEYFFEKKNINSNGPNISYSDMKTLGKHRSGMEGREREKIKTENDCYYSFWNKLGVLSRFRSSVWPCVRYAFKNELNIFPCSPSFLCADIFYSTTNGCFSFFPML